MRLFLRRAMLTLLLLNVLFLAACAGDAPANPVPEAGIPKPEAGKTAVVGQVLNSATDQPIKATAVYLAQVYWDKAHQNAAFAVDIARSPGTRTDDNGFFTFSNVEPHEYVIVVGEVYGVNDVIRTSNGDARIHDTKSGEIFNAGVLKVKPEVAAASLASPTATQ